MDELKEINQEFFPAFCQMASAKFDEWSRLLCFTPDNNFLLEQTFSDPDFDSELFIGVFREGKLVGAVLGIIRKWKDPDTGFIKFIILDEDHSQEEYGSKLIAEIEKKLHRKGVDKIFFGSASPYYLFPGVFIDDQYLRSLLTICGWQESSERISRIIDTRSMGITESTLNKLLSSSDTSLSIAAKLVRNAENRQDFSQGRLKFECNRGRSRYKGRPFAQVDIATKHEKDELLAFIESEFSKSWARETEPAFDTKSPAFCSIARDPQNNIIGFAAIHSCNPNWFGPMGVNAKLRKGGIGRLLVCHSLLYAKDQGTEKLLLPWINDKDAFYCKIIGEMEKHIYLKCKISM